MRSICDLQLFATEHVERCRFRSDPKRPYVSRAVSCHQQETVFLKRYDLSVWAGTRKWFEALVNRCELIEKITQGRTRFYFSGAILYRISVPARGLNRFETPCRMTYGAYAKLVQTIANAHELGVVHGDICARNISVRADEVDIFDWEPILLAPGAVPSKVPVPANIPDPRRWLGACGLIALVKEKASVYEVDYQGLVNIRTHFCEKTMGQKNAGLHREST